MQLDIYDDRGAVNRAGSGRFSDLLMSNVMPAYGELARRGNLFMAHAIVTAPVIFTTAAGTGGPLLWNGSTTKDAVILAVGWGQTVVTTVAAALGLTGGIGQNVAPSSTTAIDSRTNLRLGAAGSACTPYRVGTPNTAGAFFLPFAQAHTGALTTAAGTLNWVDLGGALVVPPQGWCSVAASANASTLVASIGLVWTEVPTL